MQSEQLPACATPAVAAYLQLLHDGMGVPPADYEADAQVFRSLRERTLFQEPGGQR